MKPAPTVMVRMGGFFCGKGGVAYGGGGQPTVVLFC